MSQSKSSPLRLKLCSSSGYNPNLIITIHSLSGSSIITARSPPPLLNYSATIAAGPGPSIRSAQGEGWWLTVCNRVHLDSYRPLELRQTTVLEPLGRIWLMLWGVFGCEVALTVKIYELLAAFSLLGELGEEEEEEEGEKFIPDSPGGSVAVFWPLRLFLHTGHVSCCQKQREKEYFQYSLQKGDIPL